MATRPPISDFGFQISDLGFARGLWPRRLPAMSGWPMAGLHPPFLPGRRPHSAPDGQCRISIHPPAEHAAVQVHGVNSFRDSGSGSGSNRIQWQLQWQGQWTATVSRRAREHNPAHSSG